jgi:hypothetical protein
MSVYTPQSCPEIPREAFQKGANNQENLSVSKTSLKLPEIYNKQKNTPSRIQKTL